MAHSKARQWRESVNAEESGVPESDWRPWPHQQAAEDAFEAGKWRQFLGWHRRAGKDDYALMLARKRALADPGEYWHLFPKQVQARRAIWLGVSNGRSRLKTAFPEEIVDYYSGPQDMYVRLKNGSIWYLLGSDNYDRLVGADPKGVVFSEWALCQREALEYISPAVVANHGWMTFITTFRGRNHAWELAQDQQDNADWYVDIRDVTQTVKHDGQRIITDEMIAAERKAGMSEARIQEEYYCNPLAANPGAYYGRQIQSVMERQYAIH